MTEYQNQEKSGVIESQVPSLDANSISEAKRLVGYQMRRHSKALSVTSDWIRHHAYTQGDSNPLFTDEAYARTTQWKGVIAFPTFLYLVDSTVVGPGLKGIQWIYGGTDWEWFLPVRPGDTISATVRMYDAIEHYGRHANRMIEQIGEILYWNQRDELVARALGKTMRVPRAKASGGGLQYKPRLATYTDEQLRELDRLYEREERRGSVPRYWEEVRISEELPTLHKGPLRRCEIAITGFMSVGEAEITSFQGAHIYQFLHRRAHPADAYLDPITGVQDAPHRGHWEPYMAGEAGMPGVYDVGFQRIGWLAQLMTNWIGDDGFLRKLNVTLRRPNVVGDTTFLKGKVLNKLERDDEHLVECNVWGENQDGEITVKGEATARLPSMHAKPKR